MTMWEASSGACWQASSCDTNGSVPSSQAGAEEAGTLIRMLYTFWLVRGLVIPRAASKESPLPGARLLGYSAAVTLEEKLALVELLLSQESELDGGGNLPSQNTDDEPGSGTSGPFTLKGEYQPFERGSGGLRRW